MSDRRTPLVPRGRYWASVERERIGAVTTARFRSFQEAMKSRGQREMWRRSHRAYYGQNPNGGYANSASVEFGGEQGELALIHMPEYRQLVQSMHTLATSQRPAIEATATTNDPEAQSQTIVARQVLEYDLDQGGLEQALIGAHERALIYAEGYIVDEWDFDDGDLVAMEEAEPSSAPDAEPESQPLERPVYSGAPRARVKSPIDVARDHTAESLRDCRWYIVRDRVNRYELAARYPEHAKRILGAPDACADEDLLFSGSEDSGSSGDYIHMLTLYHLPTPALPRGRYVWVIDEAAILDVPYPYDHMVVHADMPGEELDTPMGYSAAWDLLALQEALDSIESNLLTTADVGGVPSWVARKGQNVDARMIEGLRIVEYDGEPGDRPPGLAERPTLDRGQIELAERYRAEMQLVSGINAVVRGDAAEGKSGAHAALIASMAVQANSGQQRAYAGLLRSVFNGRIRLYQRYATEPRLIELTGRDSVGHVQEFTRDDLRSVRRIRVELANPYLRTVQGRKETADRLVDLYGPDVITPDRYLLFQQTGRLDDLDNREQTHKVNARRESDQFRDVAESFPPDPAQAQEAAMQAAASGRVPKVMVNDHHPIHIREHLAALDDPAIRLDPAKEGYRAIVLSHVLAHIEAWESAPPSLLSALGIPPPPLPPEPPMGGAPMGPDGPMPEGPMGPEGPPPDAAVPGAQGVDGDMPANLPNQPTNPLTGQRGAGLPVPM